MTTRYARHRLWCALGLAALCGATLPARAALSVSTLATTGVTCSASVCTATAANATLNVTELQAMLASSDVTVVPGIAARSIVVAAPVHWSSAHTLSLDAYHAIEVRRTVSVEGQGGLVLTTNDGGSGGDLSFTRWANATFWDLSSHLTINGDDYALESSIAGLASAIASNPSGNFALANPYDAKPNGIYSAAPIQTIFTGKFEGLGNAIASLAIRNNGRYAEPGLFLEIGPGGLVRDISLRNVKILARRASLVGALASWSRGTIINAYVSGQVNAVAIGLGGLVGENDGLVWRSQTDVAMPAGGSGLVGINRGTIRESFAVGTISEASYERQQAGLVAGSGGTIADCYSLSSVTGRGGMLAGLVANFGGTLTTSYSAGPVYDLGGRFAGNIAGRVEGGSTIASDYWDTTTGVRNKACGAGHCPGATGLTDTELKSGLPVGFDPAIWAEDPAINGGLPYLIYNLPRG